MTVSHSVGISYAGRDGKGTLEDSNEVFVAVRGYTGAGIVVKVAKKDGKEDTELLSSEAVSKEDSDAEPENGLWSTLSKLVPFASIVTVTHYFYEQFVTVN